jgi:hypothetical protein
LPTKLCKIQITYKKFEDFFHFHCFT